jgi:tryptophanyl-tRNA synthetase
MARILTGIQSTGRPHLGNLLGAIEPAIRLSQDSNNESLYFIADLHALNSVKNPDILQENVRAVAATWLACGFDTDKHIFYRQSAIPEVTEFTWYLGCVTPFPMLANAHSFKEKKDKLDQVNAGIFYYPVLMASDILMYDADIVPVGKDQRQHLEMARDIASSFNRQIGKDILKLPTARIDDQVMTVPGTDGQKMSKSYNNTLDIFAPEKDLNKAIKAIISDSSPLEAPKDPENDITFKLFSLVAKPSDITTLRDKYLAGGYGYGHAKKDLMDVLLERYKEPRKIFQHYMDNPNELAYKLLTGAEKAQRIARPILATVREALLGTELSNH